MKVDYFHTAHSAAALASMIRQRCQQRAIKPMNTKGMGRTKLARVLEEMDGRP